MKYILLTKFIIQISGLDTNVNFLIDLAKHPFFQAGDVHTGFIDQHFDSLFQPLNISEQSLAHAVAAIITREKIDTQNGRRQRGVNPFAQGDWFRLNHPHIRDYNFEFDGKSKALLQLKCSNISFLQFNYHTLKCV